MIRDWRRHCALLLALACTQSQQAAAGDRTDELALAEQLVDAFYAFDPGPLSEILSSAGESRQDILFYQGWAEGGNYIVMKRMPCAAVEAGKVSCSITVQDDLVLALGIDFDVTDTFTISFKGASIEAVATSSNDPQLYHDARGWVWENRKDLVQIPCRGAKTIDPDPGHCVRAMLAGYREYARVMGLEAREPRQGSTADR